MNELQIFNNPEFGQIRVIQKDNEPWFVGKDICDVLELTNPTVAIGRLDTDEVAKFNLGRQGEANLVNEYGLYSLILGSRKPEAKKFKRWITHEVIPSIRKHGAYMTDETIEKALTSPDFLIQLATQLKEAKEVTAKQQQLIGELKPKADYTDRILKNKGLVTITQIAKDYGISGTRMNKILHRLRVQYLQSGQWFACASSRQPQIPTNSFKERRG
jgi:anti-repressor protein